MNLVRLWRKWCSGLRFRLLLGYISLLSASTALSVVAIARVLSVRLEDRANLTLVREIEQFRQLLASSEVGDANPDTTDLIPVFDRFLEQNIPYDGIFLIAFLDREIYQSSPTALPESLQQNPELVSQLADLNTPAVGKYVTADDTLLYHREAIHWGETSSSFVVLQSTHREVQEIREVVWAIVQVSGIVLILFAALTWVAAGRTLAPLHVLTETAQAIGETNLSQRLPVRGSGEIAELTACFNEMLDRLEATLTSQREFVNDVGHELRTPITIIQGYLELTGSDPAEQQETFAIVSDELDRMSRLVNDLIVLAKSERPDFLHLEVLDAAVLTQDIFSKVKALAPRRWQLSQQAQVKLVGDRQRLVQAIVNLAQNASQHTQPEETIELGSRRYADRVCFWVRDRGPGIAPEDCQRIFQRFARAEAGRSRGDGSGLGLAIVRAIAQAHGGWVWVSSQIGRGATFYLELPLNPPISLDDTATGRSHLR